MIDQLRSQPVAHVHPASLPAFRRAYVPVPIASPNLDDLPGPIDIPPLQPDKFPLPCPCSQSSKENWIEPWVMHLRRIKQQVPFFRGQKVDLVDPVPLLDISSGPLCIVHGKNAILHRMVEYCRKCSCNVANGIPG